MYQYQIDSFKTSILARYAQLFHKVDWLCWRFSSIGLSLLLVSSSLLIGSLLLAACGSEEEEKSDPYARYLPAMRPENAYQLTRLGIVPQYEISITYNITDSEVTGAARIFVPNQSSDPWNDLYFRLYTNLQQYGGGASVQSAVVNNRAMPYDYEAARTALRIDLAEPLLAGASVVVELKWRFKVPEWSDSPGTYALLGRSQGITTIPLFYPSLAVYVPGPTVGTGHWWLEEGSSRGDAAFNSIALFAVTATLPSDVVPVTSGTLITSTLLENSLARHVWVTGPSREFFIQFSSQFGSTSLETHGVKVTSYWLPGEEAAGHAALRYAVASLRIYSDLFGDYPYRNLSVTPAPLSKRGMEYPQVIQVGTELYGSARENLEVLVAHEIAHQWWYLIVHNDPVQEPWLDEALAEYSVKLYMQKLHSNNSADLLQYQRWEGPVEILKGEGKDALLEHSVDSFANAGQYETIVYGKGALFYAQLHQALGDRKFFEFLHTYLDEHRYQIVSAQDWLNALTRLNKPELLDLYKRWVGEPKAVVAQGGE